MPARTWTLAVAAVCLVVCATACQGQSAPTPASPEAATTSPSPSAAAAAGPSPSPGLAVPSPSPSPAPVASPSQVAAAHSNFQFDQVPFAVMIDNIAAARPQFGLAEADVVYEAPAEGGIPRLMPIYLRAGADVDRIGPVRSARHYFIDLANEYRTPIVHIGASPQGFDALKTTGLPDLDEQRGDNGFVRDPNREAPHNAFVSTTSVRDALRERGVSVQPDLGPLNFGDYQPGSESANVVKIPYPGGERYKLEYDYDSGQQLYDRIMDGQPHLDGDTGQQYAASSIIIQFADVQLIPNDDAGRLDVGLVGSGKGILVAQGTQVPLQWSRASIRDATQFKRADGAPFELPSGQVWIQVVPLETQLSIT